MSINADQERHINNLFTYHAPQVDQIDRYVKIREEFRKLALVVVDLTPQSAQQDTAIALLHLASMSANAAIAVNE
jgi:hypothetical protein